MRRLLPVPILLVALVAATPACAIVGGTSTTINQYPYQVVLVSGNNLNSPMDTRFCGGSILDTTHVITAAHCVFDSATSGEATPPQNIDVVAAITDLTDTGPGPQRRDVTRISFMPAYSEPDENGFGGFASDAAILTLALPITLGADAAPIALASHPADDSWWTTAPQTFASVSGWGSTARYPPEDDTPPVSFPSNLHAVSVPIVSDAFCSSAYGTLIVPALHVCAGEDGKDSCQGDSGGPLAAEDPGPGTTRKLIGIVSTGAGCADARYPGVYTEVADASVGGFLSSGPDDAPRSTTGAGLSGIAEVGQTLTCTPGSWTGVTGFMFRFYRTVGSTATAVTGFQTSNTYTLTQAEQGTSVNCVVKATGASGYGYQSSGYSPGVSGRVEPPPPPTPPVTPIQTTPPPADKTPPQITGTRRSCKGSRCTVTVTTADAGNGAGRSGASGTKAVEARLVSTYRVICRKNGKRRHCTRHRTRTLKGKLLGNQTFLVTASKLPVGSHVMRLRAVDAAGNRQPVATRLSFKTRKPAAKKRR